MVETAINALGIQAGNLALQQAGVDHSFLEYGTSLE